MLSHLALTFTALLLVTPSQATGKGVLQGAPFSTVLESVKSQLLPPNLALASTNTFPLQAFHSFGQYWSTKVPLVSLKDVSVQVERDKRATTQGKQNLESTYGISDECMAGFAELFATTDSAGISDGTRALDAFGEIGAAYLEGNIHAYGGFDQCLDIPGAQYCLLHLQLKDVRPDFDGNTSIPQLYYALCLPRACSMEDIWHSINTTNQQLFGYHLELSINWDNSMCKDTKSSTLNPGGVAMVVVCCLVLLLVITGSLVDWIRQYRKAKRKELEEQSRSNLLSSQDKRMSMSTLTLNEQSRIRQGNQEKILRRSLSSSCSYPSSQRGELQWSKCKLMGNSIVEGMQKQNAPTPSKPSNKKRRSRVTPLDFLLAFSLFRTIPTIFSTRATSASVLSLNGIRSISMFWLILHHTMIWVFFMEFPNNTLRLKDNMLTELPSITITNAFFVVDTFLFLSATLVAYLTLRQMQRMKGHFPVFLYYIHRVVRIIPTYAFVVFGYWLLLPYFGDGPAWNRQIGPGRDFYVDCERYWWTNLLFINNLYPWSLEDQCVSWGWFLAIDMQFYVIAPLVIVPLYKSLVLGGGIICVLLFACFSVTASVTGHLELNANIFASSLEHLLNPDYKYSGDYLYTKPWTRLPTYLIGLIMGYIFFRGHKLGLRNAWNTVCHLGIWTLAIPLCVVSLYGIYPTWNGHQFTTAENVLYATFSPVAWVVGVALITFACYSNYGWLAGKFLSLRIWIPLSRLSFIAYLVNPIILMVFFGSIRDTVYLTGHTVTAYGLATIILSFGLAAVLASCVEFPFSMLEVLVFRLVGLQRGESQRDVGKVKETALVISNNITEVGTTRAEDDNTSSEATELQDLSTEEGENGSTSVATDVIQEQFQEGISVAMVPTSNGIQSTLYMDTDLEYPPIIHPNDPPHIEDGGSLQLGGYFASDDEEEETQEVWVRQQSEYSEFDSDEEAEQEL